MSEEALFRRDGDAIVPGTLALGPWSSDALHGGPVAALLAGLAEALQPGAMHAVRVTLDLFRPVPRAPLQARSRVIRPGRKVCVVESSLWRGEIELARASVLFIRDQALALPLEHGGSCAAPPPGPDTAWPLEAPAWGSAQRSYHSHAVEHRIVRGSWEQSGPCTDWIRLRVPVLEGQEPSPLQRVAAAADFGNGIASALPFDAWRFINPDLSIHLDRAPQGLWICLDARTWLSERGVGRAESSLWDAAGRLGSASQSLLLERR